MEHFPTEILMIIFQHFGSLNDLNKCFNSCERWKQIINKLYKDSGMLGPTYIF